MADPRLIGSASSVNDYLRNLAILRAHDIEALKNAEVNRVLFFLRDTVNPQVRRLLIDRLDLIESVGRDIGPETTARLLRLTQELHALVDSFYAKIAEDQTEKRLPRIANAEAKWQVASLASRIPADLKALDPVMFSFSLPSPVTISRIINAQPMQVGGTLKEWWTKSASAYVESIRNTVQAGIVQGRSTSEIVADATRAEVSGSPLIKSASNAETVVRTEVNHVSAEVREETWKENDDLVKGVLYVATLDTATTPICRSLDGKVFDINSGPRPPQHFNCRSTTVPILKSLKELGIGQSEANNLSSMTRASMDGQVPASVSYYEWLADQPQAIQDKVLGSERATLWRDGKVTADQFTNDRGQLLSLDDLEKRAGG